MTFKLRSGSTAARAVDHLREHGPCTGQDLAQAIDAANIGTNLRPAIKHGVIERCYVDGKVGYRLGSGVPAAAGAGQQDEAAEEPPPFNAALWMDGDVLLSGIHVNEDSSVLLTQDQVHKLMRFLLTSMPAAVAPTVGAVRPGLLEAA